LKSDFFTFREAESTPIMSSHFTTSIRNSSPPYPRLSLETHAFKEVRHNAALLSTTNDSDLFIEVETIEKTYVVTELLTLLVFGKDRNFVGLQQIGILVLLAINLKPAFIFKTIYCQLM
jgi:hypothetical protein